MQRRQPLIISLAFFLAAMAWFSRGLVFPPFYHPDEINKVIQVQNNYRNFNHPQLMLNSAALLYRAGGAPEDKMQAASLMRWVSVFFAAAAIAMLAYCAHLLAGTVAQLCCGWLLLTEPKLFEFAHYLKEDPSLAAGFAAIYLAMMLYVRQSTPRRAAFAGLAAGLAISAKYIGVFPAIVSLAAIAWHSTDKRRHVIWFIAACLITVAAINWQALVQAGQFQHGLGRELKLFEENSTDSLINSKIANAVASELGWLAWLALAAWLASPWLRGRRLDAAEWTILASTFGYSLLLLVSSRSADRYLLPISVSLPLVISAAACWAGRWLGQLLGKPAKVPQVALCVAVILLFNIRDMPGLAKLHAGFQNDTRLQLVEFIRAHVPDDAVIAEDSDAKLPDGGSPRRELAGWNLPQARVYADSHPHLAEEFRLADLRARGVTHIVILVDGSTESALDPEKKKLKPGEEKIRSFLGEIEKNGRLVWSCEAQVPRYLNPALRFYELSQPGN